MKTARAVMIVAYGLVTMGAQTLLFREFITAFEGNDISVGVFFGSWLLWVGLGAVLVRRQAGLAATLLRHVEPLFLLYIPAFLIQLLLIVRVRELAGVASYDLASVQTVVLWAMVVNAPVSLVTGLLFPVACRWIEQTHAFPVSRVYLLEALGSFAGGLAVTALLSWHVSMVRVSLLLALVLAIPLCVVCLFASVSIPGGNGKFADGRPWMRTNRRIVLPASLMIVSLILPSLLIGADRALVQALQAAKWSRLLPREALQGAFHTAQAEYLYGRYGGQWIAMREGGVCEALPSEDQAGQTAATVLCQQPQARRVLVIGSGLALCNRLLMLPQIERVSWAHPDTEYAERLLECIPREFAVSDRRFHPIVTEIRTFLRDTKDRFDLVILSLPDVTGSAFNRYYTVEFYEQIKAALRADGVVAVSVAGSEGVMGVELAGLGASTRTTLAKVFTNQILVPGEQAWLIASDSRNLSDDPAVARDRFAALEGTQRVFPPDGLLSVYQPDRTAEAKLAYDSVDLPERLLINRDVRPLAHLYGLLLAARQSGASVTRFVRLLALAGWLPFLVPIVVFVVLRTWAMAERRSGGSSSSFDSAFLVFSTGWIGIAMVILLMYLYETHFGSLYLHIGLISSLFMAGLTAGALFVGRMVARRSRRTQHVALTAILLVHAVVLAALAFCPDRSWAGHGGTLLSGHLLFALAFVLSGLCCGGYWPIAAAQLARGSLNPGAAGSILETADHLGACLGGLATSLLLVPILGTGTSLLVLTGLALANLPAALAGFRSRATPAPVPQVAGFRQAGYALFGVGACVVLCSNILVRASEKLQPSLPAYVIQALAGAGQTRHASATLSDGGRKAGYVTILDADQKPASCIFSSADFAPDVRGFGGRLNLAIHVDASGKLIDLLIVRSNETPSYLDALRGWLNSLQGQALFVPKPLASVNAVAGATVSSEAVLTAVRTSGRRFAVEVLKSGGPTSLDSEGPFARIADTVALYFLATALLAFVASWSGRAWSRVVPLAATVLLGGIALNAQYSNEQIATLLSLDVPRAELSGAFLLAVGVPILVLLFGNLYCGYLCPFGAAQELLGYVLPRRFRSVPSRDPMRAARFIKYIVLAVFVVGFFLVRDRRTLAGDPLTSVFALPSGLANWPVWMWVVVGAALVGSLWHARFWCRYLCPAGAFLSLLAHVRLLRRLVPPKWYGRCEFGLTASDHLDCLHCDRCRHAPPSEISDLKSQIPTRRTVLLAAVLIGLLVAGVSLREFCQAMPQILQESPMVVGAGGQPRNVDAQQMRTLIEQGRLSNREATHYRPVE